MINQDEFSPVNLSDLTNEELKEVYVRINEYELNYQNKICEEIDHRGLKDEFNSIKPIKQYSSRKIFLVVLFFILVAFYIITKFLSAILVQWKILGITSVIGIVLIILLLIHDQMKHKRKIRNDPQSYE